MILPRVVAIPDIITPTSSYKQLTSGIPPIVDLNNNWTIICQCNIPTKSLQFRDTGLVFGQLLK